jgi:4-hydroxybenzoate polyprenyltransferase
VWVKALRVHQWSKNLLIFVPLLTSHRIFDSRALVGSILMFLAFCCCASALYIANDLLDLTADRLHPEKRRRPFASGQLPIAAGLLAIPVLIAISICINAHLGWRAEVILLSYAAVSLSYSMRLKSYAPLDVFLLSGLYTVRILAGGIATHIWLSGWLLSFSVFLFLSLAFTKRLAELGLLRELNQERSTGRGYYTADLDIVRTFAVSAGFLSSLVLAFYVNSDQVRVLYREPLYLWLLFPVLLYWLTKLWLLASRGELREDPVLYAIKAPATYWAALISLVLLLTAKFDFLASIGR